MAKMQTCSFVEPVETVTSCILIYPTFLQIRFLLILIPNPNHDLPKAISILHNRKALVSVLQAVEDVRYDGHNAVFGKEISCSNEVRVRAHC